MSHAPEPEQLLTTFAVESKYENEPIDRGKSVMHHLVRSVIKEHTVSKNVFSLALLTVALKRVNVK